MTTVLIITDNILFDESVLESKYPQNTKFTTWINNGSSIPHPENSFQHIYVDKLKNGGVSGELVSQIQNVLAKSGSVTFSADQQATGLANDLMFNGFIDVSTNDDGSISAKKANWDVGTTFSLSTKTQSVVSQPAKTWLISDDNDEEMIDDNDLLEDEDLQAPVNQTFDCGSGAKRKACKNCTCGAADLEVKEAQQQLPTEVKSGCGSCYKGDAFRCGTCPYLGMPAFEPGETLKLSGSSLMEADI